ncbi:PAS domain-containing protein [Frankia sp. EI5c]|uniref:PAS domain-containing protein n=1 Tax=Frankia sp. EI5c TaxID=683316 RepID=UPI0008253DD0|nr:PAS domain-containing protein [Frankia sp. EI5c]
MPIDATQYAATPAADYLRELVDLFENSNIGIMVTDFNGGVRRANPAQRRLAGWADAPGGTGPAKPSARTLLGADVWERVTAAAVDGYALHNLPVELRRADGTTASALLDANGEADGGILRLVTRPAFRGSLPGTDESDTRVWHEQWSETDVSRFVDELGEDRVTALTKELEDLFELLPVPLHAMARAAEVRRTNQVHLEFLGCADEPDRFVGQNLLSIFAVEEHLIALGGSLTTEKAILNFPTTIRRLDGSLLPMRVYSSAVTRDGEFVGTRCFLFFAETSDAPDSTPYLAA